MSLTLVIEDGTGIANAESYIDATYMRQYAAKRAISLPVSDDDLIPMLVKAMDYLESREPDYIGDRTTTTQALSWPRSDVQLNTTVPTSIVEWPEPSYIYPQYTTVDLGLPNGIKLAQAALTSHVSSGIDILPVQDGKFITVDKVGPLETHYSEKLSLGIPELPLVDNLLKPFLSNGNGFSVTVGRG